MNNIKKTVEALLFASGEPLETDKICEIIECSSDDVEKAVNNINEDLKKIRSCLSVVKLDDCYQFVTHPDYAKPIRKMLEIQRNSPLSSAAFEVLAVVAYNQPVTKSFIEQVRGVDCSGVVSSLVDRGLIEEKGRLELPGRPLIYGTTKLFLRTFDIENLSQLPPLPQKQDDNEEQENEN
ncbi:MAG: SMC-Scp complex subunit ScpB [Acutalibacteraceae bacterium]|nr:SMC-Scp complex subunit ScpB [Acutalibacteraceae bacterium]